MGKIHQLSQHVSNMIAAGEVVERPSGIVKELVENAIDAHAEHIEIQIAQGGIQSIRIIDDGVGMSMADAKLAFARHATSKVKEVEDLWHIHTMGFRGEAIPSIASVSQCTLKTCDGNEASEVFVAYGDMQHSIPSAFPKGTMVEVENLFQKTPARFKHLKSPQYEFSLISDIIQKFAFAYPNISFLLTHDGKEVFKTNGSGQLKDVFFQVYGRDITKKAMLIEGQDADYKLQGLCGQPSDNRATKYFVLLYINHRMIRNYRLQKAVLDAYAPYLPKDRYPIVILNIIMDAQLVDVNVHPSKWEIRLSKEKALEKLIYTTIRDTLQQELQTVEVKLTKEKVIAESPTFVFDYQKDQNHLQIHEAINESFSKPSNTIVTNNPILEDQPQNVEEIILEESQVEEKPATYRVDLDENTLANQVETKSVNRSFPQMRAIGQFHGCYILAEGDEGLYIVDQHAAQERYHYEIIQRQILEGNKDSQPLLIPITLKRSITDVSHIKEINLLLEPLSIQFDVFGEDTLVCRELPVWMNQVDESAFLNDMIDFYLQDQEISLEKLRKHAIATMACHSSIRFNRNLNADEMKQVIADLEKCVQPFHCPHGRPTFILVSDQELFKQFERG